MADGLKRPEHHCVDCWRDILANRVWESKTDFEKIGEAPPNPPPAKVRPTPYGGPRSPLCATHHRSRKQARKRSAHASMTERVYNLPGSQYDALKAFQGGVCALCRRATGESRNLSVDHDHACCPGPTSCGECIRGVLCRPCNDLIGHARDDVAFFERGIAYLSNPPYARMQEER